jgi:hypothetical protein
MAYVSKVIKIFSVPCAFTKFDLMYTFLSAYAKERGFQGRLDYEFKYGLITVLASVYGT